MAIKIKSKGDFTKLGKFLKKHTPGAFRNILEHYGKEGVKALQEATPKDTGATAEAWSYSIFESEKSTYISWTNNRATPSGIPIVILLKYGHGTRNGGYVEGYDFIDPAIRPIFDKFTKYMWAEVTK